MLAAYGDINKDNEDEYADADTALPPEKWTYCGVALGQAQDVRYSTSGLLTATQLQQYARR